MCECFERNTERNRRRVTHARQESKLSVNYDLQAMVCLYLAVTYSSANYRCLTSVIFSNDDTTIDKIHVIKSLNHYTKTIIIIILPKIHQ